eukprot:XP_024464213.1 putative axial regulator YABBY 2 isoform X3 [Populus trichocarpa]
MGASLQTLPLQDAQKLHLINSEDLNKDSGSSSKPNKVTAFKSAEHEPPRMSPIRRRKFTGLRLVILTSAIGKLSARQQKNWAHFPHIHFGLKLDSDKHP